MNLIDYILHCWSDTFFWLSWGHSTGDWHYLFDNNMTEIYVTFASWGASILLFTWFTNYIVKPLFISIGLSFSNRRSTPEILDEGEFVHRPKIRVWWTAYETEGFAKQLGEYTPKEWRQLRTFNLPDYENRKWRIVWATYVCNDHDFNVYVEPEVNNVE